MKSLTTSVMRSASCFRQVCVIYTKECFAKGCCRFHTWTSFSSRFPYQYVTKKQVILSVCVGGGGSGEFVKSEGKKTMILPILALK